MTVRERFASWLDRAAPVVAVVGGCLLAAALFVVLFLSVEVHTLQQQTADRGQTNQALLKHLSTDEAAVRAYAGYITAWDNWAALGIESVCTEAQIICSAPPSPPAPLPAVGGTK